MSGDKFMGGPEEMVLPQCNHCRHRAADARTCAAFPGGIPGEIESNRHDHRKPYPGDNGIRFEPKDGVAVRERWFARDAAIAIRMMKEEDPS